MELHEVFEANAARLGERGRGLAVALFAVETQDVDFVAGPRGATTLSCEGVLLASAYDPVDEGRRQAEQICGDRADLLIAIGFALGHHIEAYRERRSCPVVVYEPSLSRLRAAMSLRPLPWLADEDVHVATSTDELALLVASLYTPGLSIKVHPHPSCTRLSPDAVSEAIAQIGQAKRVVDVSASTLVQKLAPWMFQTMHNSRALLKSPSFARLRNAFAGRPAVVAAAGPSLDKQLPTLARVRDRVFLIAIGQSLKALRSAGIEPDLVHVVEPQNVARQFTDAGDTTGLRLALLPCVHPDVFEIPVLERFVAYPTSDRFGAWIAEILGDTLLVAGGATVAQSAVQLAAFAGASPILLIGQDLAYTDGRVYASGSAYDFMGLRETSDGSYVLTDAAGKHRMLGNEVEQPDTEERTFVSVPGWHGDRVRTSVAYASFIEGYRSIGRGLQDEGVRLVNCTEGGARIPSVEHLSFEAALAECPSDSFDAGAILSEAARSAPKISADAFDRPLAKVRRSLDRLEREARAALRRASGASAALRLARSPQRKLQILREIGKFESSVQRRLLAAPWLDSLVQPQIHTALARSLRARDEPVQAEEVIDESKALFEAVVDGIDLARELFDQFERRLGEMRVEAAETAA